MQMTAWGACSRTDLAYPSPMSMLAGRSSELELLFLPPYAPEVNPDEYLNNDVHAHVARRRPGTFGELTEMAIAYLRTRTPEIVRGCFKRPTSATHSNRYICQSP